MSDLLTKSQQKYLEVREKALHLESDLENAKEMYVKKLQEVINKLKRDFLMKYGSHMKELEELEFGIRSVQEKGRIALNQKLQTLYLETTEATTDKEVLKSKIKEVCDEYKRVYFPEDEYQKKRDLEASKLRNVFLNYREEEDDD